MDKLEFVSLDESHFPLIHRWFNKPHVQAFYSLRKWTIEDVQKKLMPYVHGEKQMKCFIIYHGQHPIGYIQSYPIKDHPWENQNLADEVIQEAAGIDLFIGEEGHLGKGLGYKVINQFLEKYIWPFYRYCLVDPDIRNEASIRLFHKCGFVKHKQIFSKDALHQNVNLQLLIKEVVKSQLEIDKVKFMMREFDQIRLINCLNTNYDLTITNLISLPIGADMDASVYKAVENNGQSYFVKLKRGHHSDISVKLLGLLQISGIQQIIPPIKAIDGKLTQFIDDFILIVYPFIEGQNGFCYNLTEDQWITLGKTLKQIHEMEVPQSIKDQIRKEIYSPKSREFVRSLDAYLDMDLKGDEITLKLQTFMREHKAIIHRLVNQAELLSLEIQKQSPEFVLCHSDIHAGNVLIDESGTIYIVDWDEPIIAPKERDLMFIGGGVANVWNNHQEEEFFYKGYGKTNINRIILSYYRHERIVQDIEEYAESLLLTSAGGVDRQEMYKQFMGMFEANGVVDIAFKTDEGCIL